MKYLLTYNLAKTEVNSSQQELKNIEQLELKLNNLNTAVNVNQLLLGYYIWEQKVNHAVK